MTDKIDDKEQIQIPEAEKDPVSPDVKKTAEELLVKVETDQKLDKLADDVLDPELKKVFDKIDGEKEENDGQNETFTQIQQLVNEKKYIDAASKIIGRLSDIFFKDAEKPGLEKFKKFDDDIDFASLDDAKLQDYIRDMDAKINATSSYHKKLKYTYLLTLAKNYAYKKEQHIELDPKASRQCFQHELQPGNILLVNKGAKVAGDKRSIKHQIATVGLQDATNSIWTHSLIISKIENGIPYVIHSTGDIGSDGKSGVDELRLDTYLQRYTSVDVMVMDGISQQADQALQSTVEDIRTNQMGTEYDVGAAVELLTAGMNNKLPIAGFKQEANKVNCVEVLAQTMAKVYTGFEATATIKTPKDFLLQKNLKPTYLATLEAKNIG